MAYKAGAIIGVTKRDLRARNERTAINGFLVRQVLQRLHESRGPPPATSLPRFPLSIDSRGRRIDRSLSVRLASLHVNHGIASRISATWANIVYLDDLSIGCLSSTDTNCTAHAHGQMWQRNLTKSVYAIEVLGRRDHRLCFNYLETLGIVLSLDFGSRVKNGWLLDIFLFFFFFVELWPFFFEIWSYFMEPRRV